MKLPLPLCIVAVILAPQTSANAESYQDRGAVRASASGKELPPYLQCVPYAREVSGIQLYGDAHSWWDQAQGKYRRGNTPKVGAVLAFQPHRNMQLGHVAAVSKVIDSRTVLLRHANWSPINGRRGQIENDVKAIDISPRNDWSEVRVWYHPIQALGTTPWPTHGFIYSDKAPKLDRAAPIKTQLAVATPSPRPASRPAPKPVVAPASAPVASAAGTQSSPEFRNAFADFAAQPAPRPTAATSRPSAAPAPRAVSAPVRPVQVAQTKPAPRRTADPLVAAVSRYD